MHRSSVLWLPALGGPAIQTELAASLPDIQLITPSVGQLYRPGFEPRSRADELSSGLPAQAGLPVIGDGIGGVLALHLAARAPELVTQLLLMPRARPKPPTLLSVSAGLASLLPTARLGMLGLPPQESLNWWDQLRPVDVRSIAGRVRCPVCVAAGELDRPNLSAGRAICKLLPPARLVIVPGAGPNWRQDQPSLLRGVVADFLAG